MKCRHCFGELSHRFLDLGFSPPSNRYLSREDLSRSESHYPLRVFVCHSCWLVQTEDHASAGELFDHEYAYFSSTSSTWVAHARRYCQDVTARFGLSQSSMVYEVASNDGYLLRNFVEAGISCVGIEPTASTADAAERLGIPVVREFFGMDCASRLVRARGPADLICGNNVYAHVPDINDFTAGLRVALRPGGTVTLEFPHLLQLIRHVQFDTVYHEHFSYLSLTAVDSVFRRAGLRVFDVQELPTHGGSLRVFGCHADDPRESSSAVSGMLGLERSEGLLKFETYLHFQARAERIKNEFLAFLISERREGRRVAAYGAAAKGNTLLNFAGVRPDLLEFVCDAAPSKQGRYMPGSHIPILPPSELHARRPDTVVILPWNIADEVMAQQSAVHSWGGRFAVAIPDVKVLG